MEKLTEPNAKTEAVRRASLNGHQMGPWRRHPGNHFRSRSICKFCGQDLIIVSEILDPIFAEDMLSTGHIIGRWERTATDVDFTYAEGGALNVMCK